MMFPPLIGQSASVVNSHVEASHTLLERPRSQRVNLLMSPAFLNS